MTQAQLDGAMESFVGSMNVITECVQELARQAYKKGYEDGLKIREVRDSKDKIMIGDELFSDGNGGVFLTDSFIVTNMGERGDGTRYISGICPSGRVRIVEARELDNWQKTGRHVPILEILSTVETMLKEGT